MLLSSLSMPQRPAAGPPRPTPEASLFFAVLAAFAELEQGVMKARTKDGLAAARARGRVGWRKQKVSTTQALAIRKRYDDGETVQTLADSFNTSRPTIKGV